MCLLAGESLISTSAHLSNGKSTSTSTTARIETLPRVFYTRHIVNQVVGLVACACAVTYCFKWSSGVVDVNNDVDVDYLVLLVATGLVAFDLWSWSSSLSLSWSSLNESALTLAFFLVALTLAWYKCNYELLPNCYQHQYQFYLKVWMAYRVARLVLSSAAASTATATTEPTTAMKSPPPLEATRKVVKAVVAQPIDDSSSSIKSEDLWTIHGVQYDLADFVNKHPGGKETILLGQGRDCTALFESYHPFTNKHRVVLNKFQPVTAHVPAAKNVSATKNVNHKQQQQQQQPKSAMAASVVDPFYDILKKRTSERLREHGLDPELDRGASYGRVAHYLLIFTCLLASAVYHFKGSVTGSFFLAVFGWLFGSLGHDAGHFAVSQSIPLINDVCVWGMSFLCNPIMWQHQHTYAHHSHTNDFDKDPDLHHFESLLRVHYRFQHRDIHSYQTQLWFVVLAYCFVVFGECFWIPWDVIKEGTIHGLVEWTDRKRPLRSLGMFLHLSLYVGVIMIWPFLTKLSWTGAIFAVVGHITTSGLLFAIFSQINHLNEHSMIETRTTTSDNNDDTEIAPSSSINNQKDKNNSKNKDLVKNSWAASQVVTSNNFATNSYLWHFLSNGLNLQIEHHLFPGLNHCHLSIIAPVVRQTCEEYGVLYKTYESWSELMNATLEWLDRMSAKPPKQTTVSQ